VNTHEAMSDARLRLASAETVIADALAAPTGQN
jgi:hypothetical protein